MNNLSTIWTPSNCLSKSQLISYIEQKLDRDEVYLVESHLNDCELCSEALDGLMDENIEQTQSQLSDIKSAIEKKIREVEIEKDVLHLHLSKKIPEKNQVPHVSGSKGRSRWMIAASLLLLVGLGGYSVFSYLKEHEGQLAKNETSPGEQEAPYNIPDDNNTNEITQLRLDPPDTFSPAGPDGNRLSSKEKKSTSLLETKPFFSKDNEGISSKDVTMASDESSKKPANIANAPEKERMEDITTNNGNSSGYEEKNVAEPEKALPQSKKSVSGMSNSKQNSNQRSKDLSYPPQTNNNNQNAEVVSSTAKKADKPLSDYEKGKEAYTNGEYRKSIRHFENALETASGKKKEDIQYQLAQAYLMTGRNRKAEKLFEFLAQGSHYKKEASQELKKLSK